MSDSTNNAGSTQSGRASWLGDAITVFGGFMSGMHHFTLNHMKSMPLPGYARGVMSVFALTKELATGAASGGAGQGNAANGVAAALVGTLAAAAIIPAFGVLGIGFTVVTAAVIVGTISAVISTAVSDYLDHNNIDFSNPIQALSDIGNNALEGFNNIREMISSLTDPNNGISNFLEGLNDPNNTQN